MDFDQYQDLAITTAIYPEKAKIEYPAMGLANEAGEVLGKVKKWIRDETDNWLEGEISEERRAAILDELGDVLWYAALVAEDLGASFNDIAQGNLDKLFGRKERGTISGDGDVR